MSVEHMAVILNTGKPVALETICKTINTIYNSNKIRN